MSHLSSKQDTTGEPENMSRRTLVIKTAHLAEAAAMVPLVLLGQRDWDRERTFFNYDLSRATMSSPQLVEADKATSFINSMHGVAVSAYELNNAYSAEYHKSRVVPRLVYRNGEPKMRLRTEYYWDEQKGLPSNTTISRWQNWTYDINKNLQSLQSKDLIDPDKLSKIAIEAQKGDQTSQRVLSSIIYGGTAAGLVFYEEATAGLRRSYDSTYEESLQDISSPNQQARRNFLKMGAALLGLGAAAGINCSTDQKLKAGRDKLDQSLSQQKELAKIQYESLLTKLTRNNPKDLGNNLNLLENICDNALSVGITSERVRDAFSSLKLEVAEAQRVFSKINSDPEAQKQLGKLCAARIITDNLNNAGTGESRRAALGVVLEGLGVAAAMALVLVPGEIYNIKNTD